MGIINIIYIKISDDMKQKTGYYIRDFEFDF